MPLSPRRLLAALLCAAGLVDVLFGWRAAWQTGEFFDFGVFYDSALAWWSGANPYRLPNLNPPFVVAALSPLAWLPKPSAWILWQIVSLATWLLAIRVWIRPNAPATPGGPEGPPYTTLAVAVMVAHASTAAQTLMGQLVWVLAVPLALAWRAASDDRIDRAGIWLGVCLSAKPFLLPLLAPAVVDRRWRRMAVLALLTMASIAAVTALFTGTGLFQEWLQGRASAWASIPQPLNAGPAALASSIGVPAIVGVLAGGAGVLITIVRWRHLSADRRWLAAVLSALLVTPLSWIQYTAWALPLTWRVWRELRPELAIAAIALTTVPPVLIVLLDRWHAIYAVGVICWFAAVVAGPRQH